MNTITPTYDVIVAGAGVSGVLAAAAAARAGVKVLLLERYGFCGGIAAAGLMACFNAFRNEIEPYSFQAIKGYPQEIVDRLIERKGAAGKKGTAPHCVPFSTEVLKRVFADILAEAGVTILYHAPVSDLQIRDGRIESLELTTKTGKSMVQAGIFVDATGDGDVASLAGAPFEFAREKDFSMQMMFKVANIDIKRIISVVERSPEKFGTTYHLSPMKNLRQLYEDGFPLSIHGFRDYVRKKLSLNGDLASIIHKGEALFWGRVKQGEKSLINAETLNCLDSNGLTKAEIQGRKVVKDLFEVIKSIPGFEDACLTQAGAIGVQETRRIVGRYQLTAQDVLEGRRFADVIAIGINPISSTKGQRVYLKHEGYDIPYRCLLPQNVNNLLVTGRCISTDRRAFQSARSMATAMAVGQAAGTAAALASKSNTEPQKVNLKELQRALINQGGELGQNRLTTAPFSILDY